MERRILTRDIELREVDNKPVLFGYAAVFGKESDDLGWFRETINERAFDKVINDPDIMILFNHDSNYILGRTGAGTAKIGLDNVGLWYEVNPPESRTDIIEAVQRGDLRGGSIGFTVEKETWTQEEGEMDKREILEVKRLYDLGPVTFPAYPDTTVAKRNFERFKEEREKTYNNLYHYKVRLYKHSIII